jgi:hypothetical protein
MRLDACHGRLDRPNEFELGGDALTDGLWSGEGACCLKGQLLGLCVGFRSLIFCRKSTGRKQYEDR